MTHSVTLEINQFSFKLLIMDTARSDDDHDDVEIVADSRLIRIAGNSDKKFCVRNFETVNV